MVACFAGKVLATTSEWLLNSLHFLLTFLRHFKCLCCFTELGDMSNLFTVVLTHRLVKLVAR